MTKSESVLRSQTFSLSAIIYLVVECAYHGGAKRRHLYIDKHTSNCHFKFFIKFYIFATNL